MLLIVAHHYVVNSRLGDMMFNAPTSWRSVFLFLFGAWGKTGINCFVMITGYFMCESKITLRKFLKLVLEIEFYKLIFYVLFAVSGYQPVTFASFIKLVLPVTDVSSGFTSCYLLFFLLIPFLNKLIHQLNERQHLLLILLLLFMYTALGAIPIISVTMNYVSWFAVLYIVASYFRLYPRSIWEKTRLWGYVSVLVLITSMLSIIILDYLDVYYFGSGFRVYWFLEDSNKPLALLLAVSTFLFFKNVKIKQSKFINTVAASCFGVLMIHANSDAMRQWLWQDTLRNSEMYDSPYLVLHAVSSVIIVYIICTAVDYLRIRFLEKPFFRFYDRHYESWHIYVSAFGNRLCEKLHIQNN